MSDTFRDMPSSITRTREACEEAEAGREERLRHMIEVSRIYQDLMNHPGWKDFEAGVQHQINAIKTKLLDGDAVVDEASWCEFNMLRAKGQTLRDLFDDVKRTIRKGEDAVKQLEATAKKRRKKNVGTVGTGRQRATT